MAEKAKDGKKVKKPVEKKEEKPVEKKPKKAKKKKVKKKREKSEKLPRGKVHVYSLEGKSKKKISLPEIFESEIRPDLIKRDVVASQHNRRQPYGPTPRGGQRHSVEWWGKGRGVSRVPRLKEGRKGAQAPCTVGGRRAHPPRPDSNRGKKINKKERLKARASALAALHDKDLVTSRGHNFDEHISVPVVVEDKFAELIEASEVLDALDSLGVINDITRAKSRKRLRAGRGKMRGRKYRVPKSLLIVVSEFKGIEKGARNLPGVDIVEVKHLNTELMAPGGDCGRLTIFTEGAIKALAR